MLLLTPSSPPSLVFIQDERFDKTENLRDGKIPPSAFSDNWLPSFSFCAFRWLLLHAKKYTKYLIRATFTDEAGGKKERIKRINKLRLHENLYTRFPWLLKVAILPGFVPILAWRPLPRSSKENFPWKIWKAREGKIRSS